MRNECNVSEDEIRAQKANGVNHLGGIPGVFNCRFSNPYVAAIQKRKRKKPTSFIPPPSISHNAASDSSAEIRSNGAIPNGGYNSIPFWCRPLPGQYSQQVILRFTILLYWKHSVLRRSDFGFSFGKVEIASEKMWRMTSTERRKIFSSQGQVDIYLPQNGLKV